MAFPFDLHVGSWVISTHLVLDIVAFVAAIIYYIRLRSKSGDVISLENRLDLIIGAIIGALIGSRLLASFEDVKYTMTNLSLLVVFAQQTIIRGSGFPRGSAAMTI